MPVVIDQMMRKVEISYFPLRIISLVPSQTELLYDLGLEKEVVGITKFCIHPTSWFKNKTRVGGTKKLNFETIAKLNPDLIIANKEENTQKEIEHLQKLYPVWISNINNLNDALQMIKEIGKITNRNKEAKEITEKINTEFAILTNLKNKSIKKVSYFIWENPMMVAGANTFINEMLKACNFKNVFENNYFLENNKLSFRYPEISDYELKQAQPELILLSSEPFPFKQKHIIKFQAICPNAEIKIVDGEMFSWYGSRLIKSPAYFATLLKIKKPHKK